MEADISPKLDKTEHGYEGDEENIEDHLYKKDNQSLNSNPNKCLKKEENKIEIIENNDQKSKKEKSSINIEEKETEILNKIIKENKLSGEEIKGYEGDDEEYITQVKEKKNNEFSVKARKGSDDIGFYYNPFCEKNINSNTIKFQDKYIINLDEKLAKNVFIGKSIENNQKLIFKTDFKFSKDLLNEANILISLYNIERVPKIQTIGTLGSYIVLVMDYIGPSLQDCLDKCDGCFTLGTTLKISIQILNILKQIHEKGIVLRYLKPENMVIGTEENKDYVYIIDFDLAKKINGDWDNIKEEKAEHIKGNIYFMSINIHNRIEASRRDDIESLGYNLIYFMKGKFPWYKLDEKEIKEKKINIPLDELCSELPEEFKEFIIYARNLKFSEKPDYEYLKSLLLKAAEKNNIDVNTIIYDWEIIDEKIKDFIEKYKIRDAASKAKQISPKEEFNNSIDEEDKKLNNIENSNKEINQIEKECFITKEGKDEQKNIENIKESLIKEECENKF